jgi:ParB family chromosome partitioning protein
MTSTLIPVTKISPNPNQPRTVFDHESLAELAQSIAENDLLQPVPVEDNGDGTYTLVGGERRWRAFQRLGREFIPADIRAKSNHGGRELLIYALIENLQRVDMNPVDEGEAYQRLATEYGMTQAEIGIKVGKGQAIVSHRMQFARLDDETKQLYRHGRLPADTELVRLLLQMDAPKRAQVAHKMAEKRMTGRQAIGMLKRLQAMQSAGRVHLDGAQSPAMRLAQRKSGHDFDEKRPPSGWNALRQVGKVPPWASVTESVTTACQACAMASAANEAICGECPLVDFLDKLVG